MPVPQPGHRSSDSTVALRLVAQLGGRFSTEAGIDVDAGAHDVERWFLAATLFGARISAAVAVRTYRVLDDAGVCTLADAGRRTWDDLVVLLDRGGYARYDFRTARRLLDLSVAVTDRYPSGLAAFGPTCHDPRRLERALDALPGWGPTTVTAFLRELRGVWPAARPHLDAKVGDAARHLQLSRDQGPFVLGSLTELAESAGLDPRDLEAALVRLSLAHRRTYGGCAGSGSCRLLHPTAP